MNRMLLLWWSAFFIIGAHAQKATISGLVVCGNQQVPYANVLVEEIRQAVLTDSVGHFSIRDIPAGKYSLRISCIGYDSTRQVITLDKYDNRFITISLTAGSKLMEEVVITGVSKETRIREHPVAIVSVSSRQIEQTAAGNIIDALVKNVPGLNAVQTGPNISKPFIRGLGYNRMLTLYDGIRQEGQQWGDEHGIEVDAYNIDKAEVIKGPASLQYGSDAVAGVVSLFPFIPEVAAKKLQVKLTSEYQTNNNLIGNGLRLGYNNGHFLMASGGAYRVAKDYRNPVDGRVYLTRFSEKSLFALLGYKTDKGFVRLNFTLYDNRQAIPDGSRDSVTRKFTRQVYEGDQDTIRLRPVVSDKELNSYQMPVLSQHIQHYRAYLNSQWRAGAGRVDFLLGIQQNNRREYNHPTAPWQPGMYVRLNTLNYSIRYNTPAFANFEAAIGLNGMFQDNKSVSATDFPIPDYDLKDGGIYLYAKRNYSRWTVSGGIRYDIRQVHWNDFYVRPDASTGFDQRVTLPDTAGAALQFAGYQKTFVGLSASLGMTLQITNRISLKANIGRGYRAPNITEIASNGLDPGAHIIYLGNRNFIPEFSLQEDIGAEARFRDFSATVSLFNNAIRHYIYLNLVTDAGGLPVVDAQGNRTYQYRQARAQLYGAEMGLTVHPGQLNGFRFDNSLSMVYGFNREPVYKGKGIYGAYLPLIPPLKLLSSITQMIKFTSGRLVSVTPKLEMELAAAQDRYLGLDNAETATPSFALFQCGVIAVVKCSGNGVIQILLQVNNVFDKAYQSNLNRLKYFEHYAQSPNGYTGIYNMGRNGCLKISLSF